MGVNEIQSREERKNNIVHFPIVWYNALYWAGREPVRADMFSVRVIPYGFRASLTRRLVLRTEAPRAGQFLCRPFAPFVGAVRLVGTQLESG